jgi:hypothetical protein
MFKKLKRRMNYSTHVISNYYHDRHESLNSLEFIRCLNIPVPESIPSPPKLVLTQEEIAGGREDLQAIPVPRLGFITRGNTGAYPSRQWWNKMLEVSKTAGWNPVILSPQDECSLPPTNLRGLMARIYACDAVIGVSTGPTHISAALEVPTLCLMERHINHAPTRWAPLGRRAEGIAYPGKKVKFGAGMDRFSHDMVLARLENLRNIN